MMATIKQEGITEGYDSHYFHQYDNNSSAYIQSSYFNPEFSNTQIKIEDDDEDISQSSFGAPQLPLKEPKKRGRPKKIKDDNGCSQDNEVAEKKLKQESGDRKYKRKDRFNGMPEEEVVQRVLPDHLHHNLDIVIIGINPGLFAAYVGHHYAGPGNHFWKCLHLSGLTPEPMNAYDDFKLKELGIGFTNICARTTRGSADLKKSEIKEGAEILKKKLAEYKPKIAVFNGKGIYEVFSGNKNFNIGKQPDKIEGTDTILYVMPSSSARCAQLPRALDKVPYYVGLKKLRDYLRGDIAQLDDAEIIFPSTPLEQKLKTEVQQKFPEVKEESLDLEEDDTSTSSSMANMAATNRDMTFTLEQIQQQAEYQEALMASAEGIDLAQEAWAQPHQGFGGRNPPAVKNEDFKFSQAFMSFDCIKKEEVSATATSGTPIKQEYSFNDDDYNSLVSVKGPSAEKVNLDQSSPYQCHTSSSAPQYTSLGELPAKPKATANKPQRMPSSSQGSCANNMFQPQHLHHPASSRVSQSASPSFSPYSPSPAMHHHHSMHPAHQSVSGVVNASHPTTVTPPGTQPIPGYHQPVHQGHNMSNSGFANIKHSPSYR